MSEHSESNGSPPYRAVPDALSGPNHPVPFLRASAPKVDKARQSRGEDHGIQEDARPSSENGWFRQARSQRTGIRSLATGS